MVGGGRVEPINVDSLHSDFFCVNLLEIVSVTVILGGYLGAIFLFIAVAVGLRARYT